MGKKTISSTVDEETIYLLNEYIRNIDPSFNKSQYIEDCFKSLISSSDKDFAQREELILEREQLKKEREESTKRISLINAQLDNMIRKESKEKQETLDQKKMMYDSLKANDEGLDF